MNRPIVLKKTLTLLVSSAFSLALFTFSPALTGNAPKASAKTIAELQEEISANEARIAEYDAQLAELAGDKANEEAYQQTLTSQINLIKENIQNLDTEITQLNKDIFDTENNIAQLGSDIKGQQDAIDKNVATFKERLRDMYVNGNDNLASIVLGSESFYDVMSQVESANRMAEYDEKLINGILDDIEKLEGSKSELETEKLTLEMKKDDLEKKKSKKAEEFASLQEKMAQTQEVIDNIAAQEALINGNKAELDRANEEKRAEEEAILETIRKAEEEAARKEAARQAAEEAARIAAQQAAQQQANQNSDGGVSSYTPPEQQQYVAPTYSAGFAWPTPGYYFISSGYGSRWGSFHRGIDVGDAGIHGAAVCASMSGTIIDVKNTCPHDCPKNYSCGCGGGYGRYVLISHDGGYSTMYAHLASACVSIGDYVSQGQVIGYVGSTGWSTGAHLHFEIRVNGVAQNPMNYVG